VEETKKKRKFVDDTSDASAPSPGQLTTDQVLVYFYFYWMMFTSSG
jgi:hypothetical protein